jgi:hypothetical protein
LLAAVSLGCSGNSSGSSGAGTPSAEATFPFSVSFGTAPCFDRPWTRLSADTWAVSDAVTGAVIANDGTGHQSRCGFSIQFRLPASDFSQHAQVYVYDPHQQLVGLDQSNAGEANVLVAGRGGPFDLTKDSAIKGPSLTDCTALPNACQPDSVSSPPPASGTAYRRYTNHRYGFATLYPSDFSRQPPPEDGDGQEWTYDDGKVSLTAYGVNNNNHLTPKADPLAAPHGVRHVTYSNISGDVVTTSGYTARHTSIVYERDVIGSRSIDTLLWRYPTSQRTLWQSAITKTALAFQPGDVAKWH